MAGKGYFCADCGARFNEPGHDPEYHDDPACPCCESVYIVDLDDDPGYAAEDRDAAADRPYRIQPILRYDIGRAL